MKLSIIIVNYKVEKNLLICLESIKKRINDIQYEVIVVENDPDTDLSKELKKFPRVKYIRSKENNGFGAGNNLGARIAKGEYLFFLNPDTKIINGSIAALLKLFETDSTGAVAPLLLDINKKPYVKQGTLRLTPLRALFSLSFIYKYFPNNRVAGKYWLTQWNKKSLKEVDIVPGTAFIVRKKLFETIKGFDERFFLYFEESDLCNRIKEAGYKNYISPDLEVVHEWGKSTEQRSDIQKIFNASRKYYLVKHYGLLGRLVNILLDTDFGKQLKIGLFLIFLLGFSLLLRTYKLDSFMQFIPDQGWFYLSARDLILTGVIPLVGPPTSHPWIHHGPLWTYTLAFLLYIFRFNPVTPAYYIAFLGTLVVGLLFFTVTKMFSVKVGILSAMLIAASPLIVMNSRIPYHTSPIPFFVILLFLSTFFWIKGNKFLFPFMALLLGILYNHEITTFVYDIAIALIFIYGFFAKKTWLKRTLTPKIILSSIILFLIPMIPFILYDTTHEYPQTLGFLVWVGYRVIKVPLGFIGPKYVSSGSNPSSLPEFFTNYAGLIFQSSYYISGIIGIISILYFGFSAIKAKLLHMPLAHNILFLFLFIGMAGLFIHRVPIEADTLLVAPFLVILAALSILWVSRQNFLLALMVAMFILLGNTYFLFSTDFQTKMGSNSRLSYLQRTIAVERTIQLAHNKPYNITGKGQLSSFPVFLDPYKYLLWYNGYAPSDKKADTTIQVWEKGNTIVVTKIK